jgi:hypothetical protein
MSEINTDSIVMDLLKKVEEKKQQIGNAERPSWITNCSFGFDPASNFRLNIQVIRELCQLVEIHAFLTNRYYTQIESLKDLKLTETEVPFLWLGFTYEQWVSDIETRINQIRIKTKKDELSKLEARVNALISPEQLRKIELEKLMKEIG